MNVSGELHLPLAIAGVAIGYDRWTRGRVHPSYWVALCLPVLDDSFALVQATDAWAALVQLSSGLPAAARDLSQLVTEAGGS